MIKQTDHYLDNQNSSFLFDSQQGYKDYSTLLRMRFVQDGQDGQDGTVFVCTKVRHFDRDTLRIVDCDEYETVVANGQIMLTIFKILGYHVQWTIHKSRKIYHFEDFEIALDNVKELGLFIEIELKNHDNRTHSGLARIFNLLRKIGITKFKKLRRGYLSMYLNPEHDFTEWMELEKQNSSF